MLKFKPHMFSFYVPVLLPGSVFSVQDRDPDPDPQHLETDISIVLSEGVKNQICIYLTMWPEFLEPDPTVL